MATLDVDSLLSKLSQKDKIDLLSGRQLFFSLRTLHDWHTLTDSLQVVISGTQSPCPNTAFQDSDFQMAQMAFGARLFLLGHAEL